MYRNDLISHFRFLQVGAPIPVEKNPNPTPEEVNALHEKYVDELTTLFYTHRDKYADPNLQLTIV